MDSSFHRRLMRAVRRTGEAQLSETTSFLQRALAGVRKGRPVRPDAPVVSSLPQGALGSLLGGADLLGRLRDAGVPGISVPGPTGPGNPPGALFRAGNFAGTTGTRPYRLFIPSRLAHPPPLLVMLHGCTQTAEDFAAGTRMNALAEANGWLVLYPIQMASANAQRCWNWFNAGDQHRGQGEPALIADMTREIMAEFGVDAGAVFVAGMSAGGAEAALLGALYSDLFAAIGVHSGLACGAATDMRSAFMAMQGGRPGSGRHPISAIVFHGDRDSTVNPRNAAEIMAQVAEGAAGQVEHGQVPGGLAYDKTLFRRTDGMIAAELWLVHGAGHAWSGGSVEGSFTEPAGPDASAEMVRFFDAHRR